MIEVKIPLKITLFGEHAVVYGEPAIAATISEKIRIRIIPNDKMILKSNSLSIKGIKVSLDEMKLESEETGKILSYIISAINYFKEEVGKQKNAIIEIESPVEPSVGLGTSAAVVVGTVAGYSRFLGYQLQKEEIAKISYNIEKSVQGGLGSRMDTYTTALGGIIYFPSKEGYEKIENKKLNITIGYIRRIATTAEILKRVKSLKEKDEDLFNQLISSIGKIVQKAKKAIIEEDEEELGELMYVNHGLLMALGVTLPPIDNLVSTAKTLGILGCKISGGGGGGSIICTKDERAEILLSTIGAKIINSNITEEGVTITEIN
ncbi:mevalonate kinase [Acidianus sulfidivorans JP7]|uniref:Mevalonate kinase n=1 Tax=Acidianus sulfidivorans JP7 TaxID=619593 RepID=A0A2U9IP78_9CREN|nr:mevalonate kinase [Acidianus sulfidivorans]AWR97840.1 mevalonate kinase [Acidianus sulfidivorans JP7]